MELGRVRINMVQRLLRAGRRCGAGNAGRKAAPKGDIL